ncbi:DegT/DnrJ/EryC1/StrS aminotransferase family protein [uncultured Methanobrevibacter sp.]|uniref:DegT/DnrJ/EryC1/StrS family aminotransferase n=1 Tax=uncultured Methanobrevibacter sp. TaxID=253161 RepID=UPI0025DCD669|nr:DegT/DnrJ/EryC1/StrS family aminotransferase [uncultured Methanobrevibacter sp.]
MERISNLEKQYVMEALENEFQTSKNSMFNDKLEAAFAEKFHSKYAIGHCNGTATLHVALLSCGVGMGDEVIVPPLTMSSTSIPVVLCGAIPVFADCDLDTFQISADSIEKCITEKTKAIITVSLYGLAPDYDRILSICKKHNLALIEDNAECFLGEYKGKLVGEFGDFASYSFQASKHITTGEGGMLTTNNKDLADKARQFNCLGYAGVSAEQGKITKNDIQDPQYSRHVSFGFNYRMSELQAACALGQLERAEKLVQKRIEVANIFDEAIENQNVLKRQVEPEGYKNSYWAYCLVLDTDNPSKDWYTFRDLFQKNGGDGYYAAWKLSYNEPAYQNDLQKRPGVWQKYDENCCPNAEYLQKRMIQMKTNYWDIEEAKGQAEILKKTINDYQKTI